MCLPSLWWGSRDFCPQRMSKGLERRGEFVGFLWLSLSSPGFLLGRARLHGDFCGPGRQGWCRFSFFFSFRFFEDSKRDWALEQPISIQQLPYSLSKRSTRLASWRIFFLVVLDHFSPFFVPTLLSSSSRTNLE